MRSWMINSRMMSGEYSMHRKGKKRNTCKVLLEKPEGNRPLGRPRC
jgi:hypothetical protein